MCERAHACIFLGIQGFMEYNLKSQCPMGSTACTLNELFPFFFFFRRGTGVLSPAIIKDLVTEFFKTGLHLELVRIASHF